MHLSSFKYLSLSRWPAQTDAALAQKTQVLRLHLCNSKHHVVKHLVH